MMKGDPTKELWRPLKAWKAHEWVPMKEAWLRVYASLSKDMFLTRRDLKADLLAGRLVGAVRRIAKDGTETCIILEPAYCQRLEFPRAWLVEGWEAEAQEGEAWHFFVRRANLDKHYPAATPPASSTTSGRRTDDRPQRRPGPRARDEWPMWVARELIQFALAGEEMPTPAKMCQRCEDKLGYQPDIRAMQRLYRKLLS